MQVQAVARVLLAGELAFASHGVQAEALALYVPAKQAVHAVLPATMAACVAEQAKHSATAVAPEVARYVPTPQAWQGLRIDVQQRGQQTVSSQRSSTCGGKHAHSSARASASEQHDKTDTHSHDVRREAQQRIAQRPGSGLSPCTFLQRGHSSQHCRCKR